MTCVLNFCASRLETWTPRVIIFEHVRISSPNLVQYRLCNLACIPLWRVSLGNIKAAARPREHLIVFLDGFSQLFEAICIVLSLSLARRDTWMTVSASHMIAFMKNMLRTTLSPFHQEESGYRFISSFPFSCSSSFQSCAHSSFFPLWLALSLQHFILKASKS